MTTFTVDREVVEFSAVGHEELDQRWTHVDSRGHGHAYVHPDDRFPTLRWVVDDGWWCESCGEEHEEGHWECRRCGEHVEPGTKPVGPGVRRLPGRVTYLVDGQPVGLDEFKARAEEEGLEWD